MVPQLELVEGDITELETEAIVNPANAQLKLGTGVAGVIRKKGGPSIQKECDRIGGTPVGTAVITGAGLLPHRHVIHAVGPKMGEGDEDRKLAAAVRSSLALADRHSLQSIALPAISTGNFGYPVPPLRQGHADRDPSLPTGRHQIGTGHGLPLRRRHLQDLPRRAAAGIQVVA